jgi:hypothetical protein
MESFCDNGEEFRNTVTGACLSCSIDLIVYDIIERRYALIFLSSTHTYMH